ncbi:MAG: lysylphosphatidylglycerol synthase transmembrane domain-containing protein [Bacteroidaceae bacterium]|jgi:uncharacterized membrane protein YbhN (UPF0104 family)
MNRRWSNIFFLFGVAAVIVMLLTFDTDWAQLRSVLSDAGIWFPVIVLLWGFIYVVNACSFNLIINDGRGPKVSFGKVFQLTLSGYALNYVTPLGLMGGEPYRVLGMSEYVGKKRAASSVILYSMMHIYSHFLFWLTAVIIYVILHFTVGGRYGMDLWITVVLTVVTLVLLCVIWLFSIGFRRGFVIKVFGLLGRIPFVRRRATSSLEKYREGLVEVDERIAMLHTSRRSSFRWSLFLEYAARIISCLEYWLLISLFMPGFTFVDSILVMAFSSLFSNLIFFMPMQAGGYEGGMALAVGGLKLPGAYGLYTALLARVRQLVWTVIGILLIKTGKHNDKGSDD